MPICPDPTWQGHCNSPGPESPEIHGGVKHHGHHQGDQSSDLPSMFLEFRKLQKQKQKQKHGLSQKKGMLEGGQSQAGNVAEEGNEESAERLWPSRNPSGSGWCTTVVHEAVSYLYSINKKPKLRQLDSFVFFIWLLNLRSRKQASGILQLSWEGEGEQELPFFFSKVLQTSPACIFL